MRASELAALIWGIARSWRVNSVQMLTPPTPPPEDKVPQGAGGETETSGEGDIREVDPERIGVAQNIVSESELDKEGKRDGNGRLGEDAQERASQADRSSVPLLPSSASIPLASVVSLALLCCCSTVFHLASVLSSMPLATKVLISLVGLSSRSDS